MYKIEIYFLGQTITFLDFFMTFFLEKKWYSVCSFQLDNYFLGFFNIFSLIFLVKKKPFPNSYFERNSQMILGKVVNFDLGQFFFSYYFFVIFKNKMNDLNFSYPRNVEVNKYVLCTQDIKIFLSGRKKVSKQDNQN